MQRKGVCHSNLSLENIFVDPTTLQNLVIEDLGRSMRVAYNDPSNFGCVLGETEGTTRRLLQLLPQDFQTHPTENMMYLAPEILENESSFDALPLIFGRQAVSSLFCWWAWRLSRLRITGMLLTQKYRPGT